MHFLANDGASATPRQMGTVGLSFRGLDAAGICARSSHLAHEDNLGVIAVTLVVDYGHLQLDR